MMNAMKKTYLFEYLCQQAEVMLAEAVEELLASSSMGASSEEFQDEDDFSSIW